MERGGTIAGVEFSIPTGAQEIVIGVVMIVVLIRRPAGLTGGRELRLHLFSFLVRQGARTANQPEK